jgi:hypothetical protein
LTRAITIIALTCFLVVGAAATGILGHSGVSAALFSGALLEISSSDVQSASTQNLSIQGPVSNWEGKKDRLPVAAPALASDEPPQTVAALGEPLRQAYASTSPDIEAPKIITAPPATALAAPPKPKAAVKPAVQKTYALLSEVQIAGIKERLKLSASQESYWPAVENALRAVAKKIHATRQTAAPNATGAPIDPEAEEVQQLKSAAMPLLFQLREDQKREVRALARLIGLEKVASMI